MNLNKPIDQILERMRRLSDEPDESSRLVMDEQWFRSGHLTIRRRYLTGADGKRVLFSQDSWSGPVPIVNTHLSRESR